jgi:hypothetical protein
MESISRIFIFGGIAINLLSYLYIVILSFKYGVARGIMALLIGPLIVVFVSDMRGNIRLRKTVILWAAGLTLFILGTVMLS